MKKPTRRPVPLTDPWFMDWDFKGIGSRGKFSEGVLCLVNSRGEVEVFGTYSTPEETLAVLAESVNLINTATDADAYNSEVSDDNNI